MDGPTRRRIPRTLGFETGGTPFDIEDPEEIACGSTSVVGPGSGGSHCEGCHDCACGGVEHEGQPQGQPTVIYVNCHIIGGPQ